MIVMIIIIWWCPWLCESNGELWVKSCVYIRSIQNLQKQQGQSSMVYVQLWRDNDKSTVQNTIERNYQNNSIDFSSGSPICWFFTTSNIYTLKWRPYYAIQVSMAINGEESQGSLLVPFPYNSTSVFHSYINTPLNRVNGTITFDIYHAFKANFMKISNRNFLVYKTCYKLWSACLEQSEQGNRLQCLNNAVVATNPSNGQNVLNDLSRGTVWAPTSSSSNGKIPDKCWKPYNQYVKFNTTSKWFGLIRLGVANYTGWSSRSWQSSDMKPGQYFAVSFTNDSTDEVKNWQYWYADLSDASSFSQDVTYPANSTYPFFTINPLFLRRDIDPYPQGKNRLTDIDQGFNEYWLVNANLTYNSYHGFFTTWGSVLTVNPANNDNTTNRLGDVGKLVCQSVTGKSLKYQYSSNSFKDCYDTGASGGGQCTGPVYYPPIAFLYADASIRVNCSTNKDLRNCTGLGWCVQSSNGLEQWCDISDTSADTFKPFKILCEAAPLQNYTVKPSVSPTPSPTSKPTTNPTIKPSRRPTNTPTTTKSPTSLPSQPLTNLPTTKNPTSSPTLSPTLSPTSNLPTKASTLTSTTKIPTSNPTTKPPTKKPTLNPISITTTQNTISTSTTSTELVKNSTSKPSSSSVTSPTQSPIVPVVEKNQEQESPIFSIDILYMIIFALVALLICTVLCMFLYCCRQRKKDDFPKNSQPVSENIELEGDILKDEETNHTTGDTTTKITTAKIATNEKPQTNINGNKYEITSAETELSYPIEDIHVFDSNLETEPSAQRVMSVEQHEGEMVRRETTIEGGVREGDAVVTRDSIIESPVSTSQKEKKSIKDKVRLKIMSRDQSDPVPDEEEEEENEELETYKKKSPKKKIESHPPQNNTTSNYHKSNGSTENTKKSKMQTSNGYSHSTNSRNNNTHSNRDESLEYENSREKNRKSRLSVEENIDMGDTLMGFAAAAASTGERS